MLKDPMFDTLKRWMGLEPGAEIPEIPLDMTVAAMDAAGVVKGVLCAWEGPQGTLISNDHVSLMVSQKPDRFIGLASVDIRRPMAAVKELRRAVNELGLRGLRLLPWLWELPPDDRRYYPLYAACVELDIPFCLQVGHAGPLRPSEPGRPIPYLDHVALDFPELKIVGGHIGYPWTQEMIALCTKYENVYLDTSAYKAKRYPPELVAWMKATGCKKALFGSNHPMIMPADALADLDALGLDEKARARFLYENAAEVFSLEMPAEAPTDAPSTPSSQAGQVATPPQIEKLPPPDVSEPPPTKPQPQTLDTSKTFMDGEYVYKSGPEPAASADVATRTVQVTFAHDYDGDLFMFSKDDDAEDWKVFLHCRGGEARPVKPSKFSPYPGTDTHEGETAWLVDFFHAEQIEVRAPGREILHIPHPDNK
jgi:predicted TIM-barrel fold metal-dependent hydrolase